MMGFTALNRQASRHGPTGTVSMAPPIRLFGAKGEICKGKADAGSGALLREKRWRSASFADKFT